MEKKILFEQFKRSKKIYNLNEGYWKRKLNSRLSKKFSPENILFKNLDGHGKKIYDANPIFTYLDFSGKKAIRIIQDDIADVSLNDLDNFNVFISAWLDKIIIIKNHEQEEIDELVIALILTQETVNKTMDLIQSFLRQGMTDKDIEDIITN